MATVNIFVNESDTDVLTFSIDYNAKANLVSGDLKIKDFK